jgi:hypothetical protein
MSREEDVHKLRLLAQWLDLDDVRMRRMRDGHDEVQQDLRRIADLIEGEQDQAMYSEDVVQNGPDVTLNFDTPTQVHMHNDVADVETSSGRFVCNVPVCDHREGEHEMVLRVRDGETLMHAVLRSKGFTEDQLKGM